MRSKKFFLVLTLCLIAIVSIKGNVQPNDEQGQKSTESGIEGQCKLIGDVNGDGRVNISDIVLIINYVLSNSNLPFNVSAVDIDKNGQITLNEVISVINIILNQSPTNQGIRYGGVDNDGEKDPEVKTNNLNI